MFEKIASKLLSPINTAGISILGFFNLLMGLWIVLPFDSLYGDIPEILFGSTLISIGAFIMYGSLKDRYVSLFIGATASFYFWLVAMFAFILVEWHSPLWIVAFMIVCYSLFVGTNIKVNRNNLPFKKR